MYNCVIHSTMQTRRQFLGTAAVAGLARGLAGTRPNVLVIITDQQRASMLSCAGNSYVKTPNLDSLARTGVRFERTYAANPVCSPSRMSLMTGHMPSSIGMECNEDLRRPVTVPAAMLRSSLGVTFREAGYETVYGGKTHLPRGEGAKGELDGFGFEVLSRDQRGELAKASAGFLREKHQRPFLMVASFINPHDICYMAISAYARAMGQAPDRRKKQPVAQQLESALRIPEGVSEEEFFRRVCPPLPANLEVPNNELSALMVDKRDFQRYVRQHWTEHDWRMHRWAYARLTEQVDREIGVVLDALRESGRENDTLVVMTADHGDQDASHRLEHKEVLYEEATRAPFVVSWKGVTEAGAVDRDHLVSNGLDLIPTLCDFAGIKTPPSLHGRSVRPLAEGRPVRQWRESVVVESHLTRLLHRGRWKYMVGRNAKHGDTCGICPGRIKEWDGRVREMLIDLEKDPGEMVNLASDPRYRPQLEEGRHALAGWYRENGVALDSGYAV
jgi:arylsulfatase A-like enzyme